MCMRLSQKRVLIIVHRSTDSYWVFVRDTLIYATIASFHQTHPAHVIQNHLFIG